MKDDKKVKYCIAGLPLNIDPDEILDLNMSLIKRAKLYFGCWYNQGPLNLRAAAYIDNYLVLTNFVEDEEERRDMAWTIAKGSTTGDFWSDERPDKEFINDKIKKVKPLMAEKMNKILKEYKDGWTFLRLLVKLENHEAITPDEYYHQVILNHNIEHEISIRNFRGGLSARVNLHDFITKYFVQKYEISLAELNI